MLFHEIYGSYFRVVEAVLREAVAQRLTGDRISQLVRQKAFGESSLTLPTALRKSWPLLCEDLTTPIRHDPELPLSFLEKRWLRTLLQDRRIALFSPDVSGLEDVEPLFQMEDIVCFDRCADGDPYTDPSYIRNFQTILKAIGERRRLRVTYCTPSGRRSVSACMPDHLEYSEKDDKFRLVAHGPRSRYIFNLVRIERCRLLDEAPKPLRKPGKARQQSLTFLLNDERDALNRVLLHFSHFEKETVRLSEEEYRVTLRYDRDDETELLIRILSFGPMVRVVEPENFVELVRQRLEKQRALLHGH